MSSSVGRVEPLEARARRRNLQLPDLSENFHELSRRFAAEGRSDLETAAEVEAFLEEQYSYSLVTPSRSREDPLEDFLFDARALSQRAFHRKTVVKCLSAELRGCR